jgi:pSer/pThr/pTyr-binding forkhead associated (FHA) protein
VSSPSDVAAPATDTFTFPAEAKPKLVCKRGLKVGVEYPIYEGNNYIGRSDEQPVDIDLDDQEPPESIWSSRQHALITFENGVVSVEDLNSSNGTYMNRVKLAPNTKVSLKPGDSIQIGAIHLSLEQ